MEGKRKETREEKRRDKRDKVPMMLPKPMLSSSQ
jgi:hypothetical protein